MSTTASTVDRPTTSSRRGMSLPTEGEQFAVRIRRDEFTGYVMSFILHLALMIALTITVVVSVEPASPAPITVVTELPEEPLDENVPVEFSLAPDNGDDAPLPGPMVVTGRIADESHLLPSLAAAFSPSGADGKESTAGPATPSGTPFELPKNAVQAGSFAAWWTPKVERYGEKVEPGQLPREGQDYRIYVQVLVPKEHKRYKVDDLSGEIVGSDGYRQPIPDRAWTVDDKGNLVRAVGANRYLNIRNGVAEIVFKVEAASKAGVRDTILIRSRLLEEEQQMTLEFQPTPTGSD